jgi:hypothetical protein
MTIKLFELIITTYTERRRAFWEIRENLSQGNHDRFERENQNKKNR